MSNAATFKFMQTVPATPLRQHIESLHAMVYHCGIYGDALAMFEHHLMSIAVFTSVRDPIREGIRHEVEAEVMGVLREALQEMEDKKR